MPVRATPANDSAQRSNVFSEMTSLTLRRYQRWLRQGGAEDFVNATDEARIKRTKLAVERGGFVEAHRVDAVFEVVDVHAKERDAPLPVVQPRRTRDDLEDAALEVSPRRS